MMNITCSLLVSYHSNAVKPLKLLRKYAKNVFSVYFLKRSKMTETGGNEMQCEGCTGDTSTFPALLLRVLL